MNIMVKKVHVQKAEEFIKKKDDEMKLYKLIQNALDKVLQKRKTNN